MERGVRLTIRELVKNFGDFDALYINKNFVYPKRLIRMITKKTYDDKVDPPIILKYIEEKTNLIQLNQKDQCDSIFSKMYFKVKRPVYRIYKQDMYDYMFEYLDLYKKVDIDEFIEKSRLILKGEL